MEKKTLGFIAASAAAGFFATAPVMAGPKVSKDGHFCANNTCKGKSACGGNGNKNGCGGKNDCKGQGWLKKTDKASCEAAGGKWAKMKKKKRRGG